MSARTPPPEQVPQPPMQATYIASRENPRSPPVRKARQQNAGTIPQTNARSMCRPGKPRQLKAACRKGLIPARRVKEPYRLLPGSREVDAVTVLFSCEGDHHRARTFHRTTVMH